MSLRLNRREGNGISVNRCKGVDACHIHIHPLCKMRSQGALRKHGRYLSRMVLKPIILSVATKLVMQDGCFSHEKDGHIIPAADFESKRSIRYDKPLCKYRGDLWQLVDKVVLIERSRLERIE